MPKRKRRKKPTAIDLFCGCGGLSLGLRRAGFRVLAAVDADELAASTYRGNLRNVKVICSDIRKIRATRLRKQLSLRPGKLDLLAGCPPCQGFSTLRTMNGGKTVRDSMNNLLFEFVRFVRAFRPKAIMIENVPKLRFDWRYRSFRQKLNKLGYHTNVKILNAADFGVPQRRRRMILIAGKSKALSFALPLKRRRSVSGAIRSLNPPSRSRDPVHNYRAQHSPKVRALIRRIPKDGGGRKALPRSLILECHKKSDGFRDIYGRMSWGEPSPTITGGCINPSKGRFLHPAQNRAITLREAALLQDFPKQFVFDVSAGKYPIAQLIGNAFPPSFAEHHARSIKADLT